MPFFIVTTVKTSYLTISLFFLPAGPLANDETENRLPVKTRKIPRPPNAYILFARERHREVAAENPMEKAQEIITQ
jgi:hypothetical protein